MTKVGFFCFFFLLLLFLQFHNNLWTVVNLPLLLATFTSGCPSTVLFYWITGATPQSPLKNFQVFASTPATTHHLSNFGNKYQIIFLLRHSWLSIFPVIYSYRMPLHLLCIHVTTPMEKTEDNF